MFEDTDFLEKKRNLIRLKILYKLPTDIPRRQLYLCHVLYARHVEYVQVASAYNSCLSNQTATSRRRQKRRCSGIQLENAIIVLLNVCLDSSFNNLVA